MLTLRSPLNRAKISQYCSRNVSESHPSSRPAPAALERSRIVADLLQHLDFDHRSWPVDGFSQLLISAARLHFDGKLAWLSRSLGLSKGTLHGEAHEGRRPSLQRVVELAEVFGCSIRSVLLGDASHTQMRAMSSLGSRRHGARTIPPEIRKCRPRKLHTIQRRGKAISLARAADEIGVTGYYLRINYRTASSAIVASFKRRCIAEARERKEHLMAMAASGMSAPCIRTRLSSCWRSNSCTHPDPPVSR